MHFFIVVSNETNCNTVIKQAVRLGGRHNMPPPVRAKFEDCYDIDYVLSLNMSLSEPQYSLCYDA